MFSLFKSIQSMLNRLRQNKGLWFTTITVISVMGIGLCLFIIMNLTSNVSQKVYKRLSTSYQQEIGNHIESRRKTFEKLMITLSSNQGLMDAIENGNGENLAAQKKGLDDKFIANGFPTLQVQFHSPQSTNVFRNSVNSVLESKNKLFGIEVLTDGVYFVLLQPLVKGNNAYGVFEVRESIHTLRQDFEQNDAEFVFVMNKNMLEKLSLESKSGKFQDVLGDYTVKQGEYDTVFNSSLKDLDNNQIEHMLRSEYLENTDFFRTHKVIKDVNGADIGLAIVGEQVEDKEGFVTIADEMTKTVTMVALGLVTSILLFMF